MEASPGKEVPVPLESAMKLLEKAAALDGTANALARVVAAATSPRLVKNALSGSWPPPAEPGPQPSSGPGRSAEARRAASSRSSSTPRRRASSARPMMLATSPA